MADIDLGTLAGKIELEDKGSAALKLFVGELEKSVVAVQGFSKQVETSMNVTAKATKNAGSSFSLFSKIAIGSLAGVAASVGGYVTAVIKLGETGSKIAGVEKAFERLAQQAGQTGKELFEGLNKGVRATVDSMELMQGANRALSAGVKLTAKDMETLGETARAMGQAAGTDTANELDTLFRALTTGQTRMLKMKGIIVDTKKAEEEFAKSIGTTADKLNQAGKTEAARIAMMDAFEKRLKTLGKAELTFSERIKQSSVIIGNWWDDLGKRIASSDTLNKALDDIGTGLQKAFTEHGAKVIDAMVGVIEKVAEGFRALVPYVMDAVKWVGELWDWIVRFNDKFDITGKIVDVVKFAFEGLKNTIVFIAGLIQTFWNNLVDLNERFGITDKITRAAVAAFEFLKQAFGYVQQAVNGLIAAWSSMPKWLQQIATDALTAAVAMRLIGAAAGAVSGPMTTAMKTFAEWAKSISTLISSYSSLVKAISTWATSAEVAATATRLLAGAQAFLSQGLTGLISLTSALTGVELANVTATKAVTAARALSKTVTDGLMKAVTWLTTSTGLNTVAETAGTAISNLFGKAKLWLAAQTTLATGAMGRMVVWVGNLVGVELTATIATGGLSAAMKVLAVQILATTAVIGLVIIAITGLVYAAVQVGQAIPKAFKAIKEGNFWEFITARDEDNFVRRLLGMQNASKEAADKIKADADRVKEAWQTMDDELSGTTLKIRVNDLALAWGRLQERGEVSGATWTRVAKQAQQLRNELGVLPAHLADMADQQDELDKSTQAVIPTLEKVNYTINDTGEAAKESAEKMKAFRAEMDKFQGVDVLLEGYKQLGLAMAAMPEGISFEGLRKLPLEQLQSMVGLLDKVIQLMKQKGLPIPDEMQKLRDMAYQTTGALTQNQMILEQWMRTVEKGKDLAKKAEGMFGKEQIDAATEAVDVFNRALSKIDTGNVLDLNKMDLSKVKAQFTTIQTAMVQMRKAGKEVPEAWKIAADRIQAYLQAIGEDVTGLVALQKEYKALLAGEQEDSVDKQIAEVKKEFTARRAAISEFSSDYIEQIKLLNKMEQVAIDKTTAAWKQHYADAAAGAVTFGNIFKGVIGEIPNLVKAAMTGGGGLKGAIAGIGASLGSQLGNKLGASLVASKWVNQAITNIGGGMGKMVGKVLNMIPGIGAAVGALLGPVIDKLMAKLFPSDAKKAIAEIGKEWGVTISDKMGEAIESTMKTKFKGMRNNRWMAEVFNLGGIIKEVGLSIDNMDSLMGQLRQAFVFLDEGAFKVQDVAKILDESFSQFTEYYTSRNSKISKSLREIIKLDREMAVHSKAVTDFVKAQSETALQRIGNVITARGTVLERLVAAQKELEQARKDSSGSKEDLEKIKELNAEVAKLDAQLKVLPLTAAGAKGIGAALYGSFAAQVAAGASAFEVLKGMQPVIESYTNQLVQAGLSGGAAFDKIRSLSALASDEIAGPAFTAIHDYAEGLKALHNADILDQEMFTGLSEQISATYNAAVAALAQQGKDTSAAIGLVAPDLQMIWELQQDMGYVVDETTQKLLNEAIAAGQVGDAHRSVQEQMLAATEKIQFAVEGLARAFGVIIPEAAKTGAQGIEDAMLGAADITAEQALQMEAALKQALLDSKAYGLDAGQTIGEALKQAGITAVSKDGIGKIIEMLKGLPGWAELSALGIEDALNSIKVDPIQIGTNVETPEIPAPRNMPGGEQGGQGYMTGGMVAQYASRGNLIQFPKYAASGRFMSGPRGTDTVPTWLTPGEFVIKKPSVDKIGVAKLKEINDQGSIGSGSGQTVVEGPMPIIVLVSTGSEDSDVDMILRALPSVVKNKRQVRSKLREAIGLSTKAAEKAS